MIIHMITLSGLLEMILARSNYDVWYNNGSSYDLRTRIDANGYFSLEEQQVLAHYFI